MKYPLFLARNRAFFGLFLCILWMAENSIAQVAVTPAPFVKSQYFNGTVPCNGCLLYTYAAGTTTPLVSYTDSTGSTPNADPVVLDSSGYGSIWLSGGAYKLTLKTSAGATIWTVDGVNVNKLVNAVVTNPSGPQTIAGSLFVKQLENTIYAENFSGADAAAKMSACLAATTWICSAIALDGAQTGSTTVLIPTNKVLWLGSGTYTFSITPAFVVGCVTAGTTGNGASLYGNGIENTVIKISGTGASQKDGVVVSSCSGSNSTYNHVEGMTIDMQGTATSRYALALGGAWKPVVRNMLLLGASVANGAGLFIGSANIYVDTADGGSYHGEFENVTTGTSGHANYYGVLLKATATTGSNFHKFIGLHTSFNTNDGFHCTSGALNQTVSGTSMFGGGHNNNGGNGISMDTGCDTLATTGIIDIESNGGWGIANTSDTLSIKGDFTFSSNTLGSYQPNAQLINIFSSAQHDIRSSGATPNTPPKWIFKTVNNSTFTTLTEQRTPAIEFSMTSLGSVFLEGVHATNDKYYLRMCSAASITGARSNCFWYDPTLGQVGIGGTVAPTQFIRSEITGTATVDLASVASAACSADSSDVTVTGAAVGDELAVTSSTALEAGGFLIGRVTAANTARFQLCNLSGGAIDRASATYTLRDKK